MKVSITFFVIILFFSCKVKIDPPKIPGFEEVEHYPHDSPLSSVKNNIGGVIKDQNGGNITLAAIKLVVNESICVSAYSNFDGQFGVSYSSELINTKSHFIIVFKGFSETNISFYEFERNNTITLNRNDKIITEKEYLKFYEEIRSCTR